MTSNLTTPYPTVPVDVLADWAVIERGSDTFVCACEAQDSGWWALARQDGRAAYLMSYANPFYDTSELTDPEDEPCLAVCDKCGRVYDDSDLDGHHVFSPAVFRLDTLAPEYIRARELYWEANFGMER